jgi:ABC-type branched-subunit amino acid transport system substrate-binding protein
MARRALVVGALALALGRVSAAPTPVPTTGAPSTASPTMPPTTVTNWLNVDLLASLTDAVGGLNLTKCQGPVYNVTSDPPARCVLSNEGFDQGYRERIAGALQAVLDFNARSGRYVPRFAKLGACDKQIRLRVWDDARSPPHAMNAVLTMIANSTTQGDTTSPNVIVGPARSATSIPTALVTGIKDIPQISYWATSQRLDDAAQFPMFMRTIPSDKQVAYATCKFWVSQGWRLASIIYLADDYGEAYKEALLGSCRQLGMQTLNVFPYSDEDSAQSLEEMVLKASKSRFNVFMLIAGGQEAAAVILRAAQQVGALGEGSAWFVSDTVDDATLGALTGDVRRAASGILQVIAVGGLDSSAEYGAYVADWKTRNFTAYNAFLPAWWAFPANFSNATAPTGESRNIGAFAYDAVAAAGIYACEIAPTGPVPADFGNLFFKRNFAGSARFTGLTGDVAFTGSGDNATGSRDVETAHFQMLSKKLLGTTSGTYESSAVGTFNSGTWKLESQPTFCGDSAAAVVDRVMPVEDTRLAGSAVKAVCIALWAINVCIGLAFIIWAFVKRTHAVVIASQRSFLTLIAVGTIISSSAILPIVFDDEDIINDATYYNRSDDVSLRGAYQKANIACMSTVVLYSVGFVLTYSSLACKIYRVKKIFNNPKMKKVTVTAGQLVLVIGVCLAIDLAIIIAWFATAPLVYTRKIIERDYYGSPLISTGQCVSGNSTVFLALLAVFQLILLIWGCVLCYQCRNVNTAFAEGKYVTVAMFCYLQVLGLALPVLIIVSDNPSARMFVLAGVLFVNNLSVLLVIFVPKIIAAREHIETSELLSKATSDKTKSRPSNNSSQNDHAHSNVSLRHLDSSESGTGAASPLSETGGQSKTEIANV